MVDAGVNWRNRRRPGTCTFLDASDRCANTQRTCCHKRLSKGGSQLTVHTVGVVERQYRNPRVGEVGDLAMLNPLAL